MTVKSQIKNYIASQAEPKRGDLQTLHQSIIKKYPDVKLWFLDGRDESGKQITNPNIGYGTQSMHYANGSSREFYRVGFSANTTGISVYIIGLADKNYLKQTFGKTIGKATVTGYCIKFKKLADIDMEVLMQAVSFNLNR